MDLKKLKAMIGASGMLTLVSGSTLAWCEDCGDHCSTGCEAGCTKGCYSGCINLCSSYPSYYIIA